MKRLVPLVPLICCGALPALAQQPPAASKPADRSGAALQKLSIVVQKLTEETGIAVLADSSVVGVAVPAPAGPTTAENLEDRLDALVKQMPRGSAWAKVWLPAPEKGRRYSPDAVSQYVRAQASLFGKAGVSQAGMVEILGRKMAEPAAAPHVKGLGLVPYYVLTNANASANRLASLGGPGSAPGSNPVMDGLMKQLGVSSPREIPTGTYKVTIPGPDGNPVDARIHVENDGSTMKIGVEVGGPGPG